LPGNGETSNASLRQVTERGIARRNVAFVNGWRAFGVSSFPLVVPQTRYARNGDVHLAYQVWGEGERDLVLVPGFMSHVEVAWEHPAAAHYLERLGSFARVISFDQRGTGLSDPVTVTEAPDLDTRMSDIAAVTDAARSERAVIYGVSEGGPASVLFAATHPERAEALVLYGAMARSTQSDDHPWLRTVDDFTEAGFEFLLPSWGQGVIVDAVAPTRVDDTDVRAVLPTIRVPTLVLHRHGDRLVNVRSGR
jgi:pimeloyl-ACP methyl ester carboxylesterase